MSVFRLPETVTNEKKTYQKDLQELYGVKLDKSDI